MTERLPVIRAGLLRVDDALPEDIAALAARLDPSAPVKSEMRAWGILLVHAQDGPHFRMYGHPYEGRPTLVRLTSPVLSVDAEAGLVRTMNSLYRTVGPRVIGFPPPHARLSVEILLADEAVALRMFPPSPAPKGFDNTARVH